MKTNLFLNAGSSIRNSNDVLNKIPETDEEQQFLFLYKELIIKEVKSKIISNINNMDDNLF